MTKAGTPRLRDAERSKAKILAAARDQFTALGYDGATVRGIAAQAQIDPSLVIRYFTSKELLFKAAVRIDPQLPDLEAVPVDQLGRALANAFVQRWRDPAALTLLRNASANQQTANQVHATYRDQIASVAARVSPPSEALERAALVASAIVGMAMSRHILMLDPLPDTDLDVIAARLAPVVQHYLTGRLGDPIG